METGLFSPQKGKTSVLLFSSSPPPSFAEIKIRGKSTPAQNSGGVGLEQPKLTQQTDCQGRVGSLGLNQHSSHQGSQPLAAPTEPPPASLPSLPVQSWIIPVPTRDAHHGMCCRKSPRAPGRALRGGSRWHPAHPGLSHLSRHVWGSAANPLHILAGCSFLGREKSVSDG